MALVSLCVETVWMMVSLLYNQGILKKRDVSSYPHKEDSTYLFARMCYLKPFLYLRPPSLICPPLSFKGLVSFYSSASVQPYHGNLCLHSFSQPMCLGLTSARFMSWSLLNVSGIKLNFMTKSLWYLNLKKIYLARR